MIDHNPRLTLQVTTAVTRQICDDRSQSTTDTTGNYSCNKTNLWWSITIHDWHYRCNKTNLWWSITIHNWHCQHLAAPCGFRFTINWWWLQSQDFSLAEKTGCWFVDGDSL